LEGNQLVEEFTVNSWTEFKDELASYKASHATVGQSLFRGQANSTWHLETTLERIGKRGIKYIDYYKTILRIKHEIETLVDKSWIIPDFIEMEKLATDYDRFSVGQLTGSNPAYDYMIYLRHHGFPSPLLDWTRSAPIAAFFAFNPKTTSETVAIYVLDRVPIALGGSNLLNLTSMGRIVKSDKRHVHQQSDYTMVTKFDLNDGFSFVEHDKIWATGGGNPYSGYTIRKYLIPSSERIKVLKLLDSFNLNAFSLMGSEESLMDTLATREFSF
jgi:hypothetical protein